MSSHAHSPKRSHLQDLQLSNNASQLRTYGQAYRKIYPFVDKVNLTMTGLVSMARYRALSPDIVTVDLDGQSVSSRSPNYSVAKEIGSPTETSWRRRTLRFSGLLLTTAVSLVLLVAHSKGYKTHGALRNFTRNHQATTQLVVQVLANILAMIQTSVL